MRGRAGPCNGRLRRIGDDRVNEHQIVSLISLTGFLVLVAAGFRAREVGWRKGFFMAGAWAGIFAVVILFIDLAR